MLNSNDGVPNSGDFKDGAITELNLLFSNILSEVAADELRGEQISENMNLNMILAKNPELENKIPSNLLMQYLQSGGQDAEGLNEFLNEVTGQEVDLRQMLASNLNQVVNLLEKQEIETSKLVESISNNLLHQQGLIVENDNSSNQLNKKIFLEVSSAQLQINSPKVLQLPVGFNSDLKTQIEQTATNDISVDPKHINANDLMKFSKSAEQIGSEPKILMNELVKGVAKDTTLSKNGQFLAQLQSMADRSIQSTSSQTVMEPIQAPFVNAANDSPILIRPLQISTPVAPTPEWNQQFSEQIQWLGSQNIKAASIKLNPVELGPVEINIKINQETASIQFNSHSGQVRELIEQALPRLKEMMNEQGIQLANVDVQDNSAQQNLKKQHDNLAGDQNNSNQAFDQQLNENEPHPNQAVNDKVRISRGLVDYFA